MSVAALAFLVLAQAGAGPAPDDGPLVVSTLAAPADAALHLRDMDGDRRLDLVVVGEDGVLVRRANAQGRYEIDGGSLLPWPGGALGWQLVDVDGDGAVDLALLLGGREVKVHRVLAEGGFDGGELLLADPTGALPRGRRPMPFLRDVDGDAIPDAVLPGPGAYHVHLRGSSPRRLVVQMDPRLELSMGDPSRLDSEFRQELTIPQFRVTDVDGDGDGDLVTETEDLVLVHLDLSPEPGWRIDLAALRDEMGESPIDFENLLGSVTNRVSWRVVDVDGSPPHDLIIVQAGTFRIWRDGSRGDYDRPPDLLLKSSGNVLHSLVRDVDGDGRRDLQILRGDVISLGQVARLLVVPGALDFDVFTYRNVDGSFERQPGRRSTVRLEIPRLLAFFDELKEMQDELEERFGTPADRADLTGDGQADDVVDVIEGELRLYRDVVPDDWSATIVERVEDTSLDGLLETFLLADLDRLEDGAVRSIDLADIKELRLTPGWELRQLASKLTPWRSLPSAWNGAGKPQVEVVDLDADGRADVALHGALEDGSQLIQLIVQPRAAPGAPPPAGAR